MNKLLLIANYEYDNSQYSNLEGIRNEIEEIKRTFSIIEYEEIVLENQTFDSLKKAVGEFLNNIGSDDTIVIYYTGHGCHFDGHNFIVCRDSSYMKNEVKDVSFYETVYKYYDLQNITDYVYNTKKVLLVSNACRIKESGANLGESQYSSLQDEKTMISQIYATSIDSYAYDNSCFYLSFCKNCLRYEHSISDIYEAVCLEMKQRMKRSEMQNPIYINSEEAFCISNKFNYDVEQRMYQDIVDMYKVCLNQASNEEYWYEQSPETIYTDCFDLSEINYSRNRTIEIIKEYFARKNRYGFISCLMRLPIYSIVVKEKGFSIQGSNGCFNYNNNELYDYDLCEKLIEEDGREIYRGIKILSDHIFYINPYETSDTRWYELRIENGRMKDMNSFFLNSDLREKFIKVLNSRRNVFISASNRTDSIGFLKSFVYKCIVPEEKILFLNYMEKLSVYNEIDYVFINKIWSDDSFLDLYINRISNSEYKWLILSLHSSLDAFSTPEQRFKIKKLVDVANDNNLSIVFVTDFLPYAIPMYHLTKMFYQYAEYEIDLDSADSLKDTFITCIKKNDSYCEKI